MNRRQKSGGLKMEEFINGLTEKVGLNRDQAQRVVEFVQEHLSDIPKWLGSSGLMDKLPGSIGDRLEGMIPGGNSGETQ